MANAMANAMATTCASINKIILTEYTCSESLDAVLIGSIDHPQELGAKILIEYQYQAQRSKEVSAMDAFSNAVKAGRQHQREQRYEDAIISFRKALLCKNNNITMESPSVQATFASTLFDIGMIHAYITQHQDPLKALQAFELCLQISQSCLGDDHPSVARVLYEMGIIYELLSEPAEALNLFSEAIAILLSNEMDVDSQLKEIWTSLSRVQVSLGQTKDAQSSFYEAEKL
jgi:tetratricopeptide (TPR) repeat protein